LPLEHAVHCPILLASPSSHITQTVPPSPCSFPGGQTSHLAPFSTGTSPSTHGTQIPVLPVVAKPAGQSSHIVLSTAGCLPDPHTSHLVDSSCGILPEAHCWQIPVFGTVVALPSVHSVHKSLSSTGCFPGSQRMQLAWSSSVILPGPHAAQAPAVVASPTGHCTQSLWSSFGCLPAGHTCSRPASDHQCVHWRDRGEACNIGCTDSSGAASGKTHLAPAAIGSRCFASVTLLADTSRCSPTSSTGCAIALVRICLCTRSAPAPMQSKVNQRQLVETSI
jgi:hypothetical protein